MTTFPKPFRLSNAPRSGISPLRVPFGLKDGRALAPSEVSKGKACGCVCPSCGTPLAAKARTSRKRRPHFAHLAGMDCNTGRETGIHLRAKQLIADRLRVFLPAWDGCPPRMSNPPSALDSNGATHFGQAVDLRARTAELKSALLEQPLGSYVPDILAEDQEGPLLIEIRVTHAVEERKAEWVTKDGWRMLEIDLSTMDRELPHDPDAFERAVLEDAANRYWVSHPGAVDRWHQSKSDLDVLIAERNAELETARRTAEDASRNQRQMELAAEQQRVARREFMKQKERRPYLDALARLDELTSPARVASWQLELRAQAALRVQELAEAAEPAVRYACMGAHRDAWIYGVDPALWQFLATHHFVTGRPPGTQFNQREVALWVRRTFPFDRDLYRLFVAQYTKRADARRAGFAKRQLNFWAFTEAENSRIPNFYTPINSLVDRWERAGLVRRLPEPLGQCEVSAPPPSGMRSIATPSADSAYVPRTDGLCSTTPV